MALGVWHVHFCVNFMPQYLYKIKIHKYQFWRASSQIMLWGWCVCVCVCLEGRCGPFWNHVASMAAHTVCLEMYAKPWPLDLTLWPLKASEHASVRINLKSKEGLFLVENDLLLPMPREHGGRLSSNHSPRGKWPGGDPHPRRAVGDLFMTSPKAACIQCVPFITTPGAPGASL